MKINIKKICGKKTVTRDDGEKIYKILNEKWDEEQIFYIEFDNILVASVSFMDEAFGQLALHYTKGDLQKKIKFDNIVEYDRALLNDILYSRFRQKDLGENGESFKQEKVA
jgi:hypothetical protein